MSFLSDMLLPTPALEAEDITNEVQQQTANALGGSDNMGTQNDRDISLNTDDILGINEDPNGGVDDSNPESEDTPPDEDGPMGEIGDDTSGDPMGSDTTGDLNAPPEENPEESKGNDFERSRKKKLWANFKTFYEILENSIELITKYVPNINDVATIKTLDDIKDNLIDAKQIAFNTMTSEFQSISYPEMQKRYIAINNIYDLITEELKTYFDKYHDPE